MIVLWACIVRVFVSAACAVLLVLLLKSAFEEVAFTQSGLLLLGMLIVFHITAFVLGLLFVRACNARSQI